MAPAERGGESELPIEIVLKWHSLLLIGQYGTGKTFLLQLNNKWLYTRDFLDKIVRHNTVIDPLHYSRQIVI
jgi:DNA replication protein DnaC